MKKIAFISSLAILMLFTVNVDAQKFSGLDKSPMDGASFPSSYKESAKIIRIKDRCKGSTFLLIKFINKSILIL